MSIHVEQYPDMDTTMRTSAFGFETKLPVVRIKFPNVLKYGNIMIDFTMIVTESEQSKQQIKEFNRRNTLLVQKLAQQNLAGSDMF